MSSKFSTGRSQEPILASQRSEEAGETTSSRMQRFNHNFPLSYKESFSQWWANVSPANAEQDVLSFIRYLQKPSTHTQTGTASNSANASTISFDPDSSKATTPVQTTSISDPYGARSWVSQMVELSGKNRALNEFSVEREAEEVEENLVMLHGYGEGLGFFYKNFEGLSRVPNWKLYALDMLGMAGSTRPLFKIRAKDQQSKVTEAEDWFIDALEEWRIIRKIDKFTLLGHSLGGYLAVVYALKYPGHLNKLIFASPVGIPEDPYAVQIDMPDEPKESTIANEFLQDQEATSTKSKAGSDNNWTNGVKASSKKASDAVPRRPFARWISYLWDANISPFSIVRWAGPLGPKFVSGWTSRRFSHLAPNEAQALHEYAYSLFRQRGSGEYALTYILAPGAFARSPLIRRIHGVGRQPLPIPADSSHGSPSKETGIPVVMMYGENDWMDVTGGYAVEQKMKEQKVKALAGLSPKEKKNDNGSTKVLVIKKAGHHLYLDAAEGFNEVVIREMKETNAASRKRAVEK